MDFSVEHDCMLIIKWRLARAFGNGRGLIGVCDKPFLVDSIHGCKDKEHHPIGSPIYRLVIHTWNIVPPTSRYSQYDIIDNIQFALTDLWDNGIVFSINKRWWVYPLSFPISVSPPNLVARVAAGVFWSNGECKGDSTKITIGVLRTMSGWPNHDTTGNQILTN